MWWHMQQSRKLIANYTENMVTAIMMDIPKGRKPRITMEKQELMMLCAMAEVTVPSRTRNHSRKATEAEIRRARIIASMEGRKKAPFNISNLEMAKLQVDDKTLEGCREKAMKDKKAHTWTIVNECLHHIKFSRQKGTKTIQLVLPKSLREEVLNAHHDDLLGGHCGYLKTYHKIAQWYWWPKMSREIKEWVQHCAICQTHSRNYGPKIGELHPIIATRPFEIMGMDILTKLPKTERGMQAIVVFTDYFTKWVEAYPLENDSAIAVANKLITGVLCRHGAPRRIISDRGSNFTSDVFREVTELLGMKQNMTVAFNPMADGQAEKAIGTLHNTLSKLVGSNAAEWDLLIPYALWAYRTAVHATTKETPFFMVYGREAENPTDVRIRQYMENNKKPLEYTAEVAKRLEEAYERVRTTVKEAKSKMKERFDSKVQKSPYKVNDIVWLKIGQKTKDENRKLTAKYAWPYKIFNMVEGTHNLNVDIVHMNNTADKRRVSVQQLKMAKLKPEQMGEVTQHVAQQSDKEINLIKKNNNEHKETPATGDSRVVKNPKGRKYIPQARRANKAKIEKDIRDEYEVEDIIKQGKDRKTGETMYLVKWKGYTTRYNTWEPAKNLTNASRILNEWNRKQKAARANAKC